MTHPDLQIDWLRAFVTVVDAGSLSAAAPLIHRSQSAVSMQIKKLESAVGHPLLSRGPRHLEVTPLGAELLCYARRILDLQSEAQQALFGPKLSGQVRLGVPDDFASSYLTPVLKRFANQHLGVEIDLTCEQSSTLIPRVQRNELDLALVSLEKPQHGQLLFQEPLVWVGDSQYKVWQRTPLPIAVYESASLAYKQTLAVMNNRARPYRIVYHSSSLAGQRAAVESGLAVAVLTRCSVPNHLQILQNLPEEYDLPPLGTLNVGIMRSQSSLHTPAVEAIHQQMVQTLQKGFT